ncbi:MAG: AmmeMemoRadiSam system protein B [Aquificota bacterium]|nr:AmmeMemoRadiSam system protein B [Aquificota bacterium]
MERPKVRYLNVQPFGDRFLVTDPLGVSDTMIVARELLILMSLMDGNRTREDIKVDFLRITGRIITEEELSQVINMLDENLLLLSDRFRERIERMRSEVLSSGIRKPAHAGEAYPSEGEKLEAFLRESLKGDGVLRPRGVIVPHMDLRVARHTYGSVYGRIDRSYVKKVLVLGVSHYLHETPLSACPLDFETPIGRVEVDREVLEKLRASFDHDIYQDILSHIREHSIEFQTLYVKLLFPEAKIIPLIVSYGEPEDLREMARKIAESVGDHEGLLVVSSVDLSHVGKKFGDPMSYDPSGRDREYMDLLCGMKNEEAFDLLRKDGNRTRIDGQFTNFVFIELMKILGSGGGEVVDYGIYEERATDSKVSYAGAVFL